MTASPSADLTGAVLRPVRGHHAFEACVEQLATAIRLGVYPRDTFLPPERELAERMSVSRATLREAIAALRAAGMVQTTRGRGGGTVVLHKPKAPRASAAAALKGRHSQLLDALAFRRVVEPGAAELAAERELDGPTQTLLRTCLDAVSHAESPVTHRQCDSRLHLAIATACGSPLTIAAVTRVQRDLHDMLQAIPVLAVNIDHSNTQHEAIVTAILTGDPRKARRVMSEHCEDTAALLRGLLG
ncbi:Transcriptional regulator, GntR family [metagenome]|uniref:Transcriptional regulator, GntR family n=1 Tax=metagenome TaxID=256318 RepID=A0A2P2C6Q8_9ZZZZ